MSEFAILIPAAGQSSRMRGRDKLLEPVEGQPLLRVLAQRALATGADVFVTLAALKGMRHDALAGLDLICIAVPDAADGMSASLRRGVAALPGDVRAVMVLPADMPDLQIEDLSRVLSAFQHDVDQNILRGCSADGVAGHPVLFPRWCFAAFADLHGDAGARSILRRNPGRVKLIPLPGRNALTDLDTPAEWQSWRAARKDQAGA